MYQNEVPYPKKKRYGIEDNSCLQIVRKSSWKNLHVSTLRRNGDATGGARNAFLFGITHETTRGKAFTLPHGGENGPRLSTIHMSTSRVSSLQNVWHVLSFSRGFKRSSNPRNDRHQRPETIKEKYKAILCAPDASSPSSKRNYESFIYENFT